MTARFISTTTAFLNALNQIPVKYDVCFGVEKDRITGLGKDNVYYPSDIEGSGFYTYNRDQLDRLRRALNALEEMPVVVKFTQDCIYLSEIIF